VISWTAPSDGEYLIQVRNRNQRSGLDALYVLSVREATADFSLVAIQSENLSGEAATVLKAAPSLTMSPRPRTGFEGSIKVTVESLPAGLTSPPVYLAKDEAFVPLVFLASAMFKPGAERRSRCDGEWEGKAIRRTAASAVTI